MSNVSLERYYFVLYDGALRLTLKMSKMALNALCDKTLHMYRGHSIVLYTQAWLQTDLPKYPFAVQLLLVNFHIFCGHY